MSAFRDRYDEIRVGWVVLGFIVAVVGLTAVLAVAIVGISALVDRKSCVEGGQLYGVQTDYGLWTGCNVIVDGVAVTTLDKWKTTHVTVDGGKP